MFVGITLGTLWQILICANSSKYFATDSKYFFTEKIVSHCSKSVNPTVIAVGQ